MTGDTSKPGASRRRALLLFEETHDLRNVATPPFAPALNPIPPGVSSIYGAQAPFGSPAFAVRDALDLAASNAPVVAEPISGRRVRGSLWPSQRFEIRIPHAWNGRLVIAGCPGQRTEFASDRVFGDTLLSRGFAYACGNKGNGDGALLLESGAQVTVAGIVLPRFTLPFGRTIAFWQHAPGNTNERWLQEMLELTDLAREAVEEACGRPPEFVYAIGLSNGGYQVRRAIEESDAFDGALTWNAVLWRRRGNLLDSLAGAIAAMESNEPARLM